MNLGQEGADYSLLAGITPMRLLQLVTLALPWIALPGTANPYLEPRELLVMATCWLVVLWTVFRQRLHEPLAESRWMGYFTLFVVVAGLAHFQWLYINRVPDGQAIYNVYTWLPTVNVVMAFVAIRVLSSNWFHTTITAQFVTQTFCLSGALAAVYALFQLLGLDQWFVPTPTGQSWNAPTGSFGNPEHLGIYLAVLLPLCLLFRGKRYLLYFVLMLAALVATLAKGTWLVAGVGLVSYAVVRWWSNLLGWKRLLLILTVLAALVAGVYAIHHLSLGDERLRLWRQSWQFLISHFNGLRQVVPSYTGYGLGSFAMLMRNTPDVWVHNEWLQNLIELGIIGTGLLLACIWNVTRLAWERAQDSLLDAGWFGTWMALLAASLILPVGHWPQTVWIGLCAWAMIQRQPEGVV